MTQQTNNTQTGIEDPYSEYRDEKGQFTEENPGNPDAPGGEREGAGRPRKYDSGDEVAESWNILISQPPRCVCGTRRYRFKLQRSYLYAYCESCDEQYVYDDVTERWLPSKHSVKLS